MSCQRCGALFSPGAKFCAACGKAVPPGSVAVMPGPAAQPALGMPGFFPAPAPELLDGPPPAAPALPKSTNGLAVASMVLGIVWIYWIGSILALIFGYIAKGQIAESQGRQAGRGMAIAGIVLGWVGIGFLTLGVIAFLISKTH